MIHIIKLEFDVCEWYEITGTDTGTNYEFDGDVYGITDCGSVLDRDGYHLTEGDVQTIAVRNALGI